MIKIIYFAQKYSGKESEAFLIAKIGWYNLTFKTGLHVYSPIMDSHNAWQYILENNLANKPDHNFWLNRDLIILESLKSQGLIMVFFQDCYHYDTFEIGENGIGFLTIEEIKQKAQIIWNSKGAEIEFHWAELNNIRCVTYESVINNPKNQELWVDLK